MTSIPVFVGPSLRPDSRPSTSAFDWRPPARAGDLVGLLGSPPPIVCLIDGLFDSVPAPWHKEILLLMEAGTLVFGASSMGALRAAELDGFGMVGVGTIYRAYRDGLLTGDDEVALIHATETLGWAPLSVPMVEVRATLLAAVRAELLAPDQARTMRAAIHHIHYADRDWPMIARACAPHCPPGQVGKLQQMHVQLKQRDGLACLDRASGAGAQNSPLHVPRTCFIEDLIAEQAALQPPAPPPRRDSETGLPRPPA